MNTKQDSINELKKTIGTLYDKIFKLNKSFDETPKAVKFNNYPLMDGTNITSTDDQLKIGSVVSLLDDQGNSTVPSPGDMTLGDGRVITVDDAGTVTAITDGKTDPKKDKDSPAEPNADNTPPVAASKMNKNIKMDNATPDGQSTDGQVDGDGDAPEDLKARVENLEKQVADIVGMLQKLTESTTQQNETNEKMNKQIKMISEEPAEKPIKNGKKPYMQFSKDATRSEATQETIDETIMEMRKAKQKSGLY